MRPSFGFESVWSGGPFDAHGLKNAKELLKIVGRKSRLLWSGFGYFGEIAFYGRFFNGGIFLVPFIGTQKP